ncbi:M48 family metallopeptidase [Pseudomonas citronellolis]|uniref:M48 family metallopeptidase n=1 Tax=Pseudomonas citronellolis TaxID=53408 RepID=UPI000E2F1645|nr:M48 family metallopeptidase [Pseudomonas citronellolis]MCP1604443.1 Zn-dependent protease with chaperone function [Pseudomonas citronellolis]MCP1655266.1 Zn-dependent protease with chaperone function [Pseudomonas citronellolis]MCP1724484.1 Zn-dependent protease with chaperone function [Pseudomonas citronellolis]GBL55644.1 putative Zn dependent protease [Pseudomonas citronellolis]
MTPALLALPLLALLAGCQTLDGAHKAALNLVGPSTQSRVQGHYLDQAEVREYYRLDPQRAGQQRLSFDGRTLPAGEIRQQNLVQIPELQAYLQGIVERLAKGWPGEAPKLQVRITDSYAFGPSADPFGTIFVPLGMLDNVESEDEIAAMLGHEMSHVLLRHHDRLAAFQQQKELMLNVATTVVVAAVAADTGVDRSSGKLRLISKDPLGTQKTIGNTLLYTALANSFSDNVWSTAWGRTQEDQADLLGSDLMIRAGYAPRAASVSLQRLGDFQGKQEPLLGGFLKARQGAMQESLQQFDLNRFSRELNTLLDQGLGTAIAATGQYFTRSHMSPTDRDEELRKYLQREYRQQTRARVDRRSWPKVRDSEKVRASLQGYKDAYAATAALEQKQPAQAQAFIARALASPVGNQPGVRRAAFNVHLDRGDGRAALADLESIQDWSLAGPSIYDLMISYHLKRNDPQAALTMIDKAERNLGSEELFITEKLLANRQLKADDQVQSVLRKCEQYPSRKESCRKLVPSSV